MKTLTPIVATTLTSKGYGHKSQTLKMRDNVLIVKTNITIGAISSFLYSSRHMTQALQTTTPSVRANYGICEPTSQLFECKIIHRH
jgi:hypothetical protein